MQFLKRWFSNPENVPVQTVEEEPSLEYFTWLLSRMPLGDAPNLAQSPHVGAKDDSGFVDRITAAYRRAYAAFVPTSSAWDHSLLSIKADVHRALLGDNADEAARVLGRPSETSFFWGFDDIAKAPPGEVEPHELVVRRLNGAISWQKLHAMWLMDMLNSLAEAIGARRMTYPEMQPADVGAYYANVRSADQILDDIDETLGIKLQFPNPFPNETGLNTKRGIAGFRALQAVYQAWRIGQFSRSRADFKVLEIGAGLGRTAYFADLFGIKDYTIIDIPLTNAAQASFLGRTLGASRIRLHGEESVAPVRIVPATAIDQIDERYDLVVNVDSLTEMSQETAEAYWRFARKNTNTFLSINHEVNQNTVRSLYANDPDVRGLRYPYWMRRGYVEEVLTW